MNQIEVVANWKCETWGPTKPGSCGWIATKGKVAANGAFTVELRSGFSLNPSARTYTWIDVIAKPEGFERIGISSLKNKNNVQLTLLNIPNFQRNVRLKSGRDFAYWLKNVAPTSTIYVNSFYGLNDGSTRTEDNVLKADGKIVLPGLFAVLQGTPEQQKFFLKQSIMAGAFGGEPSDMFEETISFSPTMPLPDLVIDDIANQGTIDGVWEMRTILNDLGEKIKFAVESFHLKAQFRCQNGRLTGEATQFTYDQKVLDKFTVDGHCKEGRATFRRKFKLKEYLGEKIIEQDLIIAIGGILPKSLYFNILLPGADNPVGYGNAGKR